MWVVYWLVAFAFCAAVFRCTIALLDWRADRRWSRMIRDNDRRELRRSTWAAMARLGGWS